MRALVYLVSGALLAAWIAPPEGIARYALIVLLIVAAAYIDAWLGGRRKSSGSPSNVVSLFASRREAQRASSRDRRGMTLVFTSQIRAEVDELLHLLRNEGLRPVLVAQNEMERARSPRFEIRLPPRDAKRARPLIELFKLRAAKNLN